VTCQGDASGTDETPRIVGVAESLDVPAACSRTGSEVVSEVARELAVTRGELGLVKSVVTGEVRKGGS